MEENGKNKVQKEHPCLNVGRLLNHCSLNFGDFNHFCTMYFKAYRRCRTIFKDTDISSHNRENIQDNKLI